MLSAITVCNNSLLLFCMVNWNRDLFSSFTGPNGQIYVRQDTDVFISMWDDELSNVWFWLDQIKYIELFIHLKSWNITETICKAVNIHQKEKEKRLGFICLQTVFFFMFIINIYVNTYLTVNKWIASLQNEGSTFIYIMKLSPVLWNRFKASRSWIKL